MRIEIKGGDRTKTVELAEPARVDSLLMEAGFPLDMPCSGEGRCGKCRVVATGGLSEVTDAEKKLLSEKELAAGERLACRTTVTGDAVIIIPQKGGTNVLLRSELPGDFAADGGEGAGLAVDIGTTTVAAYLYGFDGTLLAKNGVPNPQSVYGADVISRVGRAMAGDGENLSMLIRAAIGKLAKELLKTAGLDTSRLKKAVLVGNTAMLYLLCGRDPSPIAAAPFVPDTLFGGRVSAQTAGLAGFEGLESVYLGRSMSAYVGADITAAALSSGMCEPGKKTFLVDIGTNGEMAVFDGRRLLCCSTAAGPAFEGVGISCGCPARNGAVSHVAVEHGGLRCEVIGSVRADGICGAGLIDAAAAMLELGLFDETGRIDEERAVELGRFDDGDGEEKIKLCDGVAITQKDIRQLQLAKAAIRAGAETLLHEAGMEPSELDAFYIAGGFGSAIDIASSARIGLIQPECAEKARAIGNAAGAGASMMLLSGKAVREAEDMAACSKTVELSTSPYFMDKYVECMCFE